MIRPGLYWLAFPATDVRWTVGRIVFDGMRLRVYLLGAERGRELRRLHVTIGLRLVEPPWPFGDDNTSATTARKEE